MLVAVEIGAVLSRYGDKLTDVSETGFDVKRLDSDDYTMYILKSGAGEIAAAAGTQFLITKYGAEFIINFGVVGGLTPEMSLAKTCVVESVVHYDFDTSTIDNCWYNCSVCCKSYRFDFRLIFHISNKLG